MPAGRTPAGIYGFGDFMLQYTRMEGTNGKKWEPINFVFYLSFAKWPVIVAVVAEIALRFLMSNYLEDLPADRADLFMWAVRISAFAYIGWKTGQAYGEVPPMGAIAGAVGGFAIGLVAALSRFAAGFQTWKLFNVVTETALTVLVGALAAFLVVYVWDMLPGKIREFRFGNRS